MDRVRGRTLSVVTERRWMSIAASGTEIADEVTARLDGTPVASALLVSRSRSGSAVPAFGTPPAAGGADADGRARLW